MNRHCQKFFARCFTILALLLTIASRTARADNDALGGANIGERLFLETRFAQFFFTNSAGDANALLTNGDPVMDLTQTIYGPLTGSFAGHSMNCRACHLVEEHESTGNRTYADFIGRSPLPAINDGRTVTTRNSMSLVDSLLPRATPLFLHFDGQFVDTQDLIIQTLAGRNYGWQPQEYSAAIQHIAHIIRDDDGTGSLAQQYGGASYTAAFESLAAIPDQYAVPSYNRMNVSITDPDDPNYVSDDQIVQNVASLIEEYLVTLVFAQDTNGNFTGSPYDVFLAKNNLPTQPAANESPLQYSRRLLRLVASLSSPQYVTDPGDGQFTTQVHGQSFAFGSNELTGLMIFLTDNTSRDIATNLQQRGLTTSLEIGNCASCHTPPAFTDFLFHNTGAAQEEYDSIHGNGAFMQLPVPGLAARSTNYDAWLPPTTNHPYATGIFELPPVLTNAAQVDLGLWNVFANPDFPAPQSALQSILPLLFPAALPSITQATLTPAGFRLAGTNGSPGSTYYVLYSTNLATPRSAWTVLSTNTFDPSGNFSVTNAIANNSPRGFYSLALGPLSPKAALPQTIALFKTPTVRDSGSSEPYLHTGRMDTLTNMIEFYRTVSASARAGLVRNADSQLLPISLDDSAVAPLTAFLRSLNEDYIDIPCPCGQ